MRLIARFSQETLQNYEIIDVFDSKIKKTEIDKNNPIAKTLTDKYPVAIWMERKIRDEFGIDFIGSFDSRPAVKHERFPKDIDSMKKDFKAKDIKFSKFTPYEYEEVKGDGVFYVPVGPIHAG
jgi:formate hydrogenlyase subunit 5